MTSTRSAAAIDAGGGTGAAGHAAPDPPPAVAGLDPLGAFAEAAASAATGASTRVLLRIQNVVLASLSLAVLAPPLLLILLLVRVESRGPALYRQLRVGRDRRRDRGSGEARGRRFLDLGGRPFVMYKLRTMQMSAELDTSTVWASSDDPRATRLGTFLRRTRLDEIPQFWNVLRGDMAVVGPRPERPSLAVNLQREIPCYRLRHLVPPGITGWAQVNRGADHSIDDVRSKLRFDLEYVRRRSVGFDLRIMLRTIPVILARRTRAA